MLSNTGSTRCRLREPLPETLALHWEFYRDARCRLPVGKEASNKTISNRKQTSFRPVVLRMSNSKHRTALELLVPSRKHLLVRQVNLGRSTPAHLLFIRRNAIGQRRRAGNSSSDSIDNLRGVFDGVVEALSPICELISCRCSESETSGCTYEEA